MKKFFKLLSWQMIFAAFLAIFFLRNLLMPLVADDLSYMFIWDGAGEGNLMDSIDPNRLQPVQSLGDVFYSQWQHYFSWGGRTIAHIIVQFFIWQGKFFFDVANTLVFAALVLLLFKIGTGLSLREMNKSYLVLILAGIYFCAPSFVITTIWLTGSCNYLWMCTLELLFLLPFAMAYRNQKLVPSSLFLVPILAVIAGVSIEPGALVTLFITFLFVLHFYREKNLQTWMKVSLIFLAIGCVILILAPGNFNRSGLIEANLNLLINFFYGFLPVFLREAILFVPIILYFVKGRTKPATTNFILTFAAASMLVLIIMLFVPLFPERAGFPSTIFLLVASLAALKEILPLIKIPVKVLTVFSAVWIASLLGCVYVEYSFHSQIAARSELIAEQKNNRIVVVPPIELPAWSETFLGSRTWDEFALEQGGDLYWKDYNNRNIVFARVHGLKKIVTWRKLE